ncbi:MAG TPA: VOC family protein [Steroidobacteraceae bacterium]|nr:VOC family protein [Steroidobacteraceae bacterium]
MSEESRFHSIAPIFQVANLQRSIDFYTRVMGFELGWTAGEPPDRASLCRDSIEITIETDAAPVRGKAYIQVNGVDEVYARVASAGAHVTVPLADRFYGMRDGRIVDPDGNELHVGEPLVKD